MKKHKSLLDLKEDMCLCQDIITTNPKYSEWTQLFENEMLLTALIDRVTFRSFVLNVNCSAAHKGIADTSYIDILPNSRISFMYTGSN